MFLTTLFAQCAMRQVIVFPVVLSGYVGQQRLQTRGVVEPTIESTTLMSALHSCGLGDVVAWPTVPTTGLSPIDCGFQCTSNVFDRVVVPGLLGSGPMWRR